jgi:hypothetical protein
MRALSVIGIAVVVAALITGASTGPVPADIPAPAPVALARPLTAAPADPTGLVAGTPCRASARACVDVSAKKAWLVRNGKVEYGPVNISPGRKGHRTPTGTFRVSFKNRNHVSSIYKVPMPYAVFFNGDIAFHHGNLRSGSAGCVRLSRAAAQTFFNTLRVGDVVQVVR